MRFEATCMWSYKRLLKLKTWCRKNKEDIIYYKFYLSNYMAVNVGQFTHQWEWDLGEYRILYKDVDNTLDGACKQRDSLRKAGPWRDD